MELVHNDVLFEHWTGMRVQGKRALTRLWTLWFADHGDFTFTIEDIFVDKEEQKVLFQWQLDWPSPESGHKGLPEVRRGLDILHFLDGKIVQKLTYSKTTVIIENRHVPLKPTVAYRMPSLAGQ
jgi:hypothetical protein